MRQLPEIGRVFERGATPVVGLCALLILFIPFKTPFNSYDEGYAVFYATRIMGGDVPYRDFWAVYPPGQFLALAILFKVFGTTLMVSRIYDTLSRFTIALAMYWITRKTASRTAANIALITGAIMLAAARFYSYALFPALALGLLAIFSFLEYADTGRRLWLQLAGVLIGVTAFFRWDAALYIGVSFVATVVLLRLFGRADDDGNGNPELFSISRLVAPLATALVLVVVYYGSIGAISGWGNLWDQAVIFPAVTAHRYRVLPLPVVLSPIQAITDSPQVPRADTIARLVSWASLYFPVTIYLAAILHLASQFLKRRIGSNTRSFGSVTICVLGLLLFPQALNRYDSIHVLPTSLLAVPILVTLGYTVKFRPAVGAMNALLFVLLAGMLVLYDIVPSTYLATTLENYPLRRCYSQLDRLGCVPLWTHDQERAVEYIRTHAAADEPIFVGNSKHDIVPGNDIGLYFLAARRSATRYSELHPGVATTLPVQRSIVQELKMQKVRWMVLVKIPDPTAPNASAISSGVHYLDDFIHSRYSIVARYGAYEILACRKVQCRPSTDAPTGSKHIPQAAARP